MKNVNQLGIWMDHSVAYLMEFTTKPFEIHTIVCEFPMKEKSTNTLKKNESINSTTNYILNKYYNKIGQAIMKYKKIVLIGPSDAKINFFDFLSEDERFLKLKIEIKDADKMDVNQQHDFIKEYFIQDL